MGTVISLLTMQTCSCNTSCKTCRFSGSYSASTLAACIVEQSQVLNTGPWHRLELVLSSPGTHQNLPRSSVEKIKLGLLLRAARSCRQESHVDDSTEQASACTAGALHLLWRQWEAEQDGQEHRQREPLNNPSACEEGGSQATSAPDAFWELQYQLPAPLTGRDTGFAGAKLRPHQAQRCSPASPGVHKLTLCSSCSRVP